MAGDFDVVLYLSVLLLMASGCLIVPSLLGVGGSLVLAAALAVLGVSLFLGRTSLADVRRGGRFDLANALEVLWIGPVAAAVVVAGTSPTSPGELQTLGGLLGLIGMVNYFLLPIYGFVWSLVR